MSLRLKEVKKHEPSQFTIEFSEFYQEVMLKLYNLEQRQFVVDVKKALKSIRQLNHDIGNWDEKLFFENVSFKNQAARCAYMYAYSIINTSIVYCEFLKYLKAEECRAFQMFSPEKKVFSVCCLGAGPGMEVVGICRAIHDVVWNSSKNDRNSSIFVHVTMVDICTEWKSEASLILNTLNKRTELFQPRGVCFEVEYIQADLLKPLDGALREVIRESDIVTIVKLVNAIHKTSNVDYTSELVTLVKSVTKSMTEERCLFMLDTSGGRNFNRVMAALASSEKRFIRKTNTHKAYRLHPTVLEKLKNAIDFSDLLPTPLTRISSCIWIRLHVAVKEETKKEENAPAKEKKKKEKNASGTEKKKKDLNALVQEETKREESTPVQEDAKKVKEKKKEKTAPVKEKKKKV